MIIAVTQFNKKRNNLELNPKLEIGMLMEEIKEFWDATTVAQRLDALVDTEYVFLGTRIKFSNGGTSINRDMRDWIEDSINLMYIYLNEELGEHFYICHTNAKTIVSNANAIKGNKLDEDGKVMKDDEYSRKIDATKQIAEMIEEVTKPKPY